MITLQLTEQNAQALAGLIDAGVRAVGARAARDAADLLDLLNAAMKDDLTTTTVEIKKGEGDE